ncbi:hypothetical protein WR25_22637 [Diploscapter pachys]|uniref:Uncharacterized protein n=1 Tax=Diploscapter pachys TaxID=2018661 RepID=A0A2A2L751_9BILA|nr:hypothetical protein WR25_22637 [Diploscapter pachys]
MTCGISGSSRQTRQIGCHSHRLIVCIEGIIRTEIETKQAQKSMGYLDDWRLGLNSTTMPLLAVAVAGKTENAYANDEESSRSKAGNRDKLEMKRSDKEIEIYEISWIKRCNQLRQRKGMEAAS